MCRLLQYSMSGTFLLILSVGFGGCAGPQAAIETQIPQGVVFTDSIPRKDWSKIELPQGNDIYFIGRSPLAASTTAAQLNIIRQGQIFLQDSLQRFYQQIRHDTLNYPVFQELTLEDTWFSDLTRQEPFTGALVSCHYKKGKIYENYSVRRQWLAIGLVQWPNHLHNSVLEARLRLAIRESTTPAERQAYQAALTDLSANPVILNIESK